MITLYAHEKDQYVSYDAFIVMRRDLGFGGMWELFHNGIVVDRDRYRYDLAERHDLKLSEEKLSDIKRKILNKIKNIRNNQNVTN